MLITHIICWVKFIRLRFPLNNFIIHKIDLALFTQSYNELVIYLPGMDLQTLAYLKWSFLQQHVTDEDQKRLLQRASTQAWQNSWVDLGPIKLYFSIRSIKSLWHYSTGESHYLLPQKAKFSFGRVHGSTFVQLIFIVPFEAFCHNI